MTIDLSKFLRAQETDYPIALAEIKAGKKQSCWMWYIFPQYKGLGVSNTSVRYAINSLEEAHAFLSHPILGSRLTEITEALLKLENKNPFSVFGSPDDMKLKSCMTLFDFVDSSIDNVFKKVLDVYFDGIPDNRTLQLIQQ
jgi:uncharacterized protein (DUF1810 family)